MRRFAVALALLLAVAAVTAGSAGSRTSKAAFAVSVEPTISAASNGLTLETDLEGTFNVANKTASGGGSYSLMAGTTVVDNGKVALTRLVAFQFYGCGEVTTPDGRITLPPNLARRRGVFAVALDEIAAQRVDPPHASRVLASLSVAMQRAVARAGPAASAGAAVDGAASTVLASFFREDTGRFHGLATRAEHASADSSMGRGFALGRRAGDELVARAAGDGADTTFTGTPPVGP